MMGKNTKLVRVDAEFAEFLEEIADTRKFKKMDKKKLTPARISLAIKRVPKLKDILMAREFR